MHMAGEHDVGLVALDPFSQPDIAEKAIAAPTRRRPSGRGVMNPDPGLRRLGRSGLGELLPDTGPYHRSVPPRADSKENAPELERLAVRGDAFVVRRLQPARGLLAGLVLGIEVVIA